MDAGLMPGREAFGSWAGREALLSSSLDAVQALNERCLGVLHQISRQRVPDPPRFVGALASELRALDPRACPTIARQPFLFVDFAFGSPRTLLPVLSLEPKLLRFPAPRGVFPEGEATALARGVLVLAQSVCRHHPAHACLLLGLHPQLHQPMASLRLPDLDRVAEESPHLLTPRWEGRPDIWRALLATGESLDPGALEQFRMYGIQLIAGELSRRMAKGR